MAGSGSGSVRGKGSKGLGKGALDGPGKVASKRHSKVTRDNIQGRIIVFDLIILVLTQWQPKESPNLLFVV
jgi:hypothetical protein